MENANSILEPVLAWESLRSGQLYPEIRCALDDRFVEAYLHATGETHPLYAHYVPPLSLTYVRFAKTALGGRWPNGTLQISQGLRCHRPLRRGEDVAIGLRIGLAEVRDGRSYLELVSTIRDANGKIACEQTMTNLWVSPSAAPPAPRAARGGQPTAPSISPSSGAGHLGPRTDRFPAERIRAYAAIAGAHDPVHLDADYARTTPVGVNIAQGQLVMTLISQLMVDQFNLRWLERGTLDLRLRRPVRVDELVTAHAVPSGDGTFSVWCENACGERVIAGTASV